MLTVAEFTADSDAFPLGSVFDDLPDVTVELERVVPTNHTVIPYFWIRGTEVEDVASKFAAHPGVREIQLVDSVGDEYLLRCVWVLEYDGILTGLLEAEVALLSAVGTKSKWVFEVRSEDRESIRAFQQYCLDRDIPITPRSLRSLASERPDRSYGLTNAQREALTLAYEHGYFDEPRQTTLAEVASELGISRQALASRLRRGHNRLIDSMLVGP